MAHGKALLYCAGGGIGDSLMATLAARALRQKYAAVDALTLPSHRSMLERVPDLDEVLVDDSDGEEALAKTIESRAYDACIVTWATARTARIPQRARIPIRVGQARRLYSWRFTHQVQVRSELGDVTTHWSQIVLDYARALGCDTADATPRFVPTDADAADADRLRANLRLSYGDYLILHPTNAIAPKRGIWPIQGWAALAAALRETFDVPILLTGSQADAAINGSILRRAQDDEATRAQDDEATRAQDDEATQAHDMIDVAGKTGIGAFGALAQGALGFVGITTGSMHIAAAVGAPTVGIFPFQTDTPERWAPIGARTAIVRASYPCRPGERKETCPDYACVANLDVPRIIAAVKSLLAARPAQYSEAPHRP